MKQATEYEVYRASPHLLVRGDVLGCAKALWAGMGEQPADVIYTDPPWNEGILKRFYSWAHVKRLVPFDMFLPRLARLYRQFCPQGYVVIEMGVPQYEFLKLCLTRAGLYGLAEATTYYGPNRTVAKLWVGSAARLEPPKIPYGMEGPRVRAWVADTFGGRGKRVLDPCCGESLCLVPFIDAGSLVCGVELIERKLKRGFSRYRSRGLLVERVDV